MDMISNARGESLERASVCAAQWRAQRFVGQAKAHAMSRAGSVSLHGTQHGPAPVNGATLLSAVVCIMVATCELLTLFAVAWL